MLLLWGFLIFIRSLRLNTIDVNPRFKYIAKKKNCDFYAKKLQNWFKNEGIKPPKTYKIVDLWNEKEVAIARAPKPPKGGLR